ncbi:hypothetical protein QCA50_016440 [Cerrena zonata]|uniref:HMA domain-containing protein n=1 Tax=Cerrena zonata TaxID=2478898 RepID=A0AAW0FH98_9APHY
MSHQYHFNVQMSCSGCSGAVNRVLTKLDGVSDIKISLEEQTVDVTTSDSLDYDTVYNTISKTGKKVIDGTKLRYSFISGSSLVWDWVNKAEIDISLPVTLEVWVLLLDSKVAVGCNCSESTLGSEGYASPNSTFSCLTSKLARFGSFNLELESLADLRLDADLSTTFSNFWGVIPNLKTPQEILDELCRGFFDTLDGCKISGDHSSNDSSKAVFIGKEEKAKTVLREATNVVKEYNSIEDSDLLILLTGTEAVPFTYKNFLKRQLSHF